MQPLVQFPLAVFCSLGLTLGVSQAQVVELTKLRAADGAPGDQFGVSVSLFGDRALVGALADDELAPDAGAAYVFERQPDGAWLEIAKLRAADGEAGELFGIWVSLSGDRALVGALFDDDLGPQSGSAYVFERQPNGTWSQVAKLTASDGGPGQWFGTSVALHGDTALVGASRHDPGAAYVFERDVHGVWNEVAKLQAADGFTNDFFGHELALVGGRALVGAYADGPTPAQQGGAAYVFERQPAGPWAQVARLTASDAGTGKQFGFSVSLTRDRALVGSGGNSPFGLLSGSAYVFDRAPSGTWVETAQLVASGAGEGYGFAVGVQGDRAVVSAFGTDVPLPDAGAAFLFERQDDGTWVQAAALAASEPVAGDLYGYAISLAMDRVLLGAWGFSGHGDGSGSAYLLDVLPLSSLVPQLSLASGGAQVLALDAGHLHAGEPYLLLGSFSGTLPGIPLGSGLLLPLNTDAYLEWTATEPGAGPLVNAQGTLSAAGSAQAAFLLPAGSHPALAGLTLHHAFVTLAPGAGVTSVSNAFPLLLVP